jgi:GNAT superfamily N-acetyltransferase
MESEGLSDPRLPATEAVAAMAAWLRGRLDSPTFGAFVADVDGQVVGSGGVTVYDVPPGPGVETREAYVMSMYTLASHRGRGVARALLAATVDFARAAGAGQVWLRASAMGRPLYLRAGFEPSGSYLVLRRHRELSGG